MKGAENMCKWEWWSDTACIYIPRLYLVHMECEQSLPVCAHSGVTCKVNVMRPLQTRGTKYGKSASLPVTLSLSHHDISLKVCMPSLLPGCSKETGKHEQSQKLEHSGLRKARATFLCQVFQSEWQLEGMQMKYWTEVGIWERPLRECY